MKQATVAEHQLAIAVLARRSARKAVEARLKAQGIRVSLVPVRDINALVNEYLAEHRAFFVVEAKQAIATWAEIGAVLCLGDSAAPIVYRTRLQPSELLFNQM